MLKNIQRCLSDTRCLAGRDPSKATNICSQCGYLSSEMGMRKHIQRHHSEKSAVCIVCGREFGLMYDMRRHRLKHFNKKGKMCAKDLKLYLKNHPGVKRAPDLSELEQGFHSESDGSQLASDSVTHPDVKVEDVSQVSASCLIYQYY